MRERPDKGIRSAMQLTYAKLAEIIQGKSLQFVALDSRDDCCTVHCHWARRRCEKTHCVVFAY